MAAVNTLQADVNTLETALHNQPPVQVEDLTPALDAINAIDAQVKGMVPAPPAPPAE